MLSGSGHDVYLECAPGARVADLERALAARFGIGGEVRLFTADGPLTPESPLTLRAGSTVHVTRTPAGGGAPGGTRELRVVAGPDAGLIVALPASGTVTVGRSPDNEVRLSGTAVSRRHAALRCAPGAVELSDTGSAHGTLVDGARIAGATRLGPASTVQIGDDRIVIHDGTDDTGAAVELDALEDGSLRVSRQHRFLERAAPASIVLPLRPARSSKATSAVGAGAAGGLVLGAVAFLVWHNLAFLLFSAVSTATLLGSGAVAWWRARRERTRANRRYAEDAAHGEAALSALLAAERVRLHERAPDVVRVLLTARRPGARLWERRPAHDDFLELRLGLADQPSEVVVRDPDGGEGPDAPTPVQVDVPITVGLATAGTIGITGPRPQARALARWLVVQACVHSGPADLGVAVLARPGDEAARQAWDWVRWLPHARPDSGPLAHVGGDESSLVAQIEALCAVVANRRGAPGAGGDRRFGHNWLVVVDSLPEHDIPGLADILAYGPDVGVFVVAVDRLPYRCPVVAEFTDEAHLRLRRAPAASGGPAGGGHASGHGPADLTGVLADQVSTLVAEQVGRALAPLSDPETAATGSALPTEVSLVDLVHLDRLAERWRRAPRHTGTVVGRTGDGPLYVDIAADGPHALVAGATGWGKSALLQTLVAGLALANRPDELGFILVDFKGGAAFSAFARLPHTVGTITNLDGRQVMRALDSLAGEMERRQRYLAAAGVEKLEEYQRRADAGDVPPGCPDRLPRLLVVIDEFAMLKDQLPPEILTRLVHVATQGRSLGLHLVIGTQTPRGVVPAEIRPNVNLQVALHLPADHSLDVVGIPDASGLAVKGRGYLRRGEDADVTLFQSAYVGGRSRRAAAGPVRVLPAPWERLGHAPDEPTGGAARDIDAIVDAVRAAAAEGGLAGPARPWLEELPAELPLPAPDPTAHGIGYGSVGYGSIVYGLEDHPEQRAQPPAVWSLDGGTNLLVAGRPRSGRSTLLRTIAVSAARSYRPDELHLYVMDCGGALADLAALPHCGAVVTPDEPDRGARLLSRLESLCAAPSSIHTVLLIDDWDTWEQTFGEVDNGALHDRLVRIARRGPAAGVHVAVAGSSALLASGRARALAEASQDRLALPFDPSDYAWLGVPSTALPARPRPGQAVRVNPPHRTVQVALPGPLPSGVPGEGRPWRLDRLPEHLDLADAQALPRGRTPLWVPVGAGGDELSLLGIDLAADGPGLVVAGDRRSGRSTALLAIALDLLDRGTEVVVLAPARSPLRELSGVDGVAAVLNSRQPTARHAQLALAAASGRFVVLVDDAEQLVRTDANAVLRDLLVDSEHALVAACALDEVGAPAPGTFLAEAGRGGTAVLLAPRSARVHLFGALTRIPEAYVRAEPVGRAVLMRPRGPVPVQVPYASPADAERRPSRRGQVPALLQVTDALAGPGLSTVDKLRAIVVELRAAGFDDLEPVAVDRAVGLAGPGWSGSPGDLVAAARA
jgi:S-DNA-T family DNA segregation ATPase FtsK/SpoIIIE